MTVEMTLLPSSKGNGRVDVSDLLVVLGAFGCSCASGCPYM